MILFILKKRSPFILPAIMMRTVGMVLIIKLSQEQFMHHLPYLHKQWQEQFPSYTADKKNRFLIVYVSSIKTQSHLKIMGGPNFTKLCWNLERILRLWQL